MLRRVLQLPVGRELVAPLARKGQSMGFNLQSFIIQNADNLTSKDNDQVDVDVQYYWAFAERIDDSSKVATVQLPTVRKQIVTNPANLCSLINVLYGRQTASKVCAKKFDTFCQVSWLEYLFDKVKHPDGGLLTCQYQNHKNEFLSNPRLWAQFTQFEADQKNDEHLYVTPLLIDLANYEKCYGKTHEYLCRFDMPKEVLQALEYHGCKDETQ